MKKLCANKNCKHYDAKAHEKLPATYCSLKCKYDDPEIASHIPYYGY